MNLEPLHIPELLEKYHIHPQKSLGQNFLADHNALKKIIQDAQVSGEDDVLEIGAGLGSLTRLLAAQAKSVTAVEIDRRLFPVLESVTQHFDNVRLVQGDILKIPLQSLFSKTGYLVVANIPYYITSAVLRHLLEAKIKPKRVVLTIQREVAERILNKDEKMSLLSLSVQVYGEAHITTQLPAACFIPQPSVDSSVLVIEVYPQSILSEEGLQQLFRLAHAAFNQKRKMLRKSLKPIIGGDSDFVSSTLHHAGIDPIRRPESLTLEEWIHLADWLSEGA